MEKSCYKSYKIFNTLDYLVIIIANQSGIVRNYFKERDVSLSHNYMRGKLLQHKAKIDYFFYCPQHEDGIGKHKKKSKYRKPKREMIIKSEKKWNINLSNSYFVDVYYIDYQKTKKKY